MLLIKLCELFQGIIQRHHIGAAMLKRFQVFIQFYLAFRAAFGCAMTASVVHQDLSHQSRCNGNEVFTVLRLKGTLIRQAQVGLMNQCRGLQSVGGTFALKVMVSKGMQLIVEKRNQGVERLAVACLPLFDQLADGLG